MNITAIEEKLAAMLSPKRFAHSQRVSQTAVILAEKFGVSKDKAALAGILHDCARDIALSELLQMAEAFAIVMNDIDKIQSVLLHAPVGARIAKEKFAVADSEVLSAISRHTVGGTKMSSLDKIIYLADFIEPGRKCSNVEDLRDILRAGGGVDTIDKAMLKAFESSIKYTLAKGELIHMATIEGRNDLLLRMLRS